ncbi:DNA-3-methyladenine glycosylase [Microtetraspora sp. NBRC 13810]|uniref:AlkA N-terminal domain-containing protein n=1 Tax=Microtetraspora sp. NBRC 13810 TaxID=3030990 RepID=UPI0024A0C84E|nr:AlkA N-terminal domain-containing protein [Microtetraspora sp. NBRC 13810]GLW05439.1 DNA-3-methyladenine glycosylase [Microtetraspora sp. NBRC 13810]
MTTTTELDFSACYRALAARDARFDGRFYTAVTSTRIYCRPICPARTPEARNVRFYRHAATAEAAGFRPCKRCRPEISPGDPGWDVRGDLVSRALRLIDEGVADDAGVAGLANRLHITQRHLHRLFTAHLGASPLAVARTKRLLLAKQLLTETSLPVTDVAFAAGFGSVRQFNATMKETYGFAPGELRATAGPRRRGTGVAEDTGSVPGGPVLTLRLNYRPPFDGGPLLRFLATRAIPGLESADATRYARTVPGGTITLTPVDGHVRLEVAVADTRHLARIVARCRRLLDLDADPAAISETLGESALRPLLLARPGLRVPGAWDGFELAVRAVVGRGLAPATARGILGRLAGAGRPGPHPFPTPESLAGADLDGAGIPPGRAASLKAIARAIIDGDIDLDGAQDPATTTRELLRMPGIGPWTAGYIAMRALRDPDAWPDGDIALRRIMSCLAISEHHIPRWRPWRAYAALHLWSTQ